jgi:hypothetical protein
MGPPRCRRPRVVVQGTHRGRFAAHEDRVGLGGCRPLALDEADGAQCAEQERTRTALRGDGPLGGSMVAMVIWE